MTKKQWGGRFTKEMHPLAEKFNASLKYDLRLAMHDVVGSIAHAKMLGKCKIIPSSDAAKIIKGLSAILKEIKKGKFNVDLSTEDVHTVIQNALEGKIGSAALKLHSARSRNDQVSLAVRMCCKDAINSIVNLIGKAQDSLSELAKKNEGLIIPGYTHLQQAQAVNLHDYLYAYIEKLNRDKERLLDTYKRIDTLPLGSCALGGTTLKIDRKMVAKSLHFSKISTSTLDAVSDRDFVIEIISAIAICGVHLSRLSEDFIIFSSAEFGLLEIGDEFCTGSSLMPQKKNPDCLELIRGYSAKLIANNLNILTLMKGLPLTYNKDMQLDKLPLFDSIDIISEELSVLAELLKSVKFNKIKIRILLENESLYATDLAEYLVKKGLASKEAHTVIGKLIRYSLDESRLIADMTNTELERFSPLLKSREVCELLNPERSVKAKS